MGRTRYSAEINRDVPLCANDAINLVSAHANGQSLSTLDALAGTLEETAARLRREIDRQRREEGKG